MTRLEADNLISQRIAKALAAEDRRDAQAYESPEYWRHHDNAQRWHRLAEELMPASARTIAKD